MLLEVCAHLLKLIESRTRAVTNLALKRQLIFFFGRLQKLTCEKPPIAAIFIKRRGLPAVGMSNQPYYRHH